MSHDYACFFCFFKGYIHTCKELGEGAATTGQPKYCYCTGRKQSGSGQQESCRFPGKEKILTIGEIITCNKLEQAVSLPVALLFPQEAQAYADDNSLLFMETSAKTAMNVNEIFMAIGTCHLKLTQGHIDSYVNKTFVDVTSGSK